MSFALCNPRQDDLYVRLKFHGEGVIIAVLANGRRHPACGPTSKGGVQAAVAVVRTISKSPWQCGHHDLAIILNGDVVGALGMFGPKEVVVLPSPLKGCRGCRPCYSGRRRSPLCPCLSTHRSVGSRRSIADGDDLAVGLKGQGGDLLGTVVARRHWWSRCRRRRTSVQSAAREQAAVFEGSRRRIVRRE